MSTLSDEGRAAAAQAASMAKDKQQADDIHTAVASLNRAIVAASGRTLSVRLTMDTVTGFGVTDHPVVSAMVARVL